MQDNDITSSGIALLVRLFILVHWSQFSFFEAAVIRDNYVDMGDVMNTFHLLRVAIVANVSLLTKDCEFKTC